MDYAKLKPKVATLLTTDDKLSDQAVADELNKPSVAKLVPISSAELLAWSAADGRFARIEKAESNENPAIASLAKAARYLIIREGTCLDLNLLDRVAYLAAMVAAGILTKEELDGLYAKATVLVSWAASEGLEPVGDGHVASAREMI